MQFGHITTSLFPHQPLSFSSGAPPSKTRSHWPVVVPREGHEHPRVGSWYSSLAEAIVLAIAYIWRALKEAERRKLSRFVSEILNARLSDIHGEQNHFSARGT